MASRLLGYAGSAAGLCLAALVVGFGIQTIEPVPTTTTIATAPDQNLYATWFCVENGNVTKPFLINDEDYITPRTLGDARAAGMRPDPKCTDAEGFVMHKTTMSHEVLRTLSGLGRSLFD